MTYLFFIMPAVIIALLTNGTLVFFAKVLVISFIIFLFLKRSCKLSGAQDV
jgi:hypothetical protein